MSQQRDYKNSFESRQGAALSALVLLVALVLSFGVSAYEISMGMGIKSLLEPLGILIAVLLAGFRSPPAAW